MGGGAAPPLSDHAAVEEGPTAGRSLPYRAMLPPLRLRATAPPPRKATWQAGLLSVRRWRRAVSVRPWSTSVTARATRSPLPRRCSCPPGGTRSKLWATMVTQWCGTRGEVSPLMGGLLRLCPVCFTCLFFRSGHNWHDSQGAAVGSASAQRSINCCHLLILLFVVIL